MKGLMLSAEWVPKRDYKLSQYEKKTGKALTGSSIWRNPQLEIKEVARPEIKADEVLIKIKACGVCGSDMHMYEADKEGYILYPAYCKFPTIIGHEFSGVIEEVGSEVKDFKVGDMVTAEEMNWCGKCFPCRRGYPNHCENLEETGFTINGGFAEYLATKAKYCWKIDELVEVYGSKDKAFEAGSLVEPTSVAYNGIFAQAGGFNPGSYVCIHGAGPIGLASIALAKVAGAGKVIAFELIKSRMELAKKMGADYVFDPDELKEKGSSPSEEVLRVTNGQGADLEVEAAGDPVRIFPEMVGSLAIKGKIVQIGRAAERLNMYLEPFLVGGRYFLGSIGHSGHGTFGYVVRLMASGKIDMTKIITSRFNLENAVDGIVELRSREDGKITVKM